MDRPQWDRIQEIYYSALSKAQTERRAFVASACQHDPDCEREVNLLLEADASLSGFLETPIFDTGLRIIGSADAPTQDDLIGTTIDKRYLLEVELPHGGIGKVYLALDLDLHNRPVVIKILSELSLLNPYVVRKFRQEVEALSRIDHPNVVGLLDTGELIDGKPYIVMQYIDGSTLRAQNTSEGMNLQRAASLLKQIGVALDAVHDKGILHRDLKPENIMLQVLNDSTELVKIVDFGIARVKDSALGRTAVTERPIGTLVYMSPEQLRGREETTAASDIYSMAVVAYEMITGRRPFNPASGAELLEMQGAGVRVMPSDLRTDLPLEAQAIILKALSFDPSSRYQCASEFGDSLANALNKRTTSRDLRKEKLQLVRWPKKRVILTSFLITLVCAAVVLAFYIKQRSSQSGLGSTRSFTYWLTVQKMRDGKLYRDPFKSNGDETYESGDMFRLIVSVADPGYLYVINEASPEPNKTSFTMVFPSKMINNGSATLGANQSVQSDWIIFRGPAGAENLWIVWSASPVSQLEFAKAEAFKQSNAGLTDQSLATVKEFLRSKQSEIKTRTTRYKASQTAVVRGTGDMLVTLAQVKHR